MPGRIKTLVLLGFAAVAGAAAHYAAQRAPAETERVARAPDSLAAPTDGAATFFRYGPEPGFVYVYDYERAIAFRAPSTPASDLRYRGELVLEATKTGGEVELLARAVVKEQSSDPGPYVRVRMDREGRSLQLWTAGATDETSRQYVAVTKDLLGLWAFATDEDSTGRYTAVWDELPARGSDRVQRKRKSAYASPAPAEILRSAHWLRWDTNLKLPAELRGEEETRPGGKSGDLTATTSYRIKFREKRPASGHTGKILASLQRAEKMALAREPGGGADHQAVLSWAELSVQLRGLGRLRSAEQLKVFGELVRALRAQPELLASILSALSREEIRLGAASPLFRTVVGALATVGTPAAQAALVKLYQNPELPISGKGTILTAFTTTQAGATQVTLDFLTQEMRANPNRDLADGAAFALGSGLQLKSGAEGAANLAAIRSSWGAAQESGDRRAELAILDAMGNSGRSEYLPELRAVIASEDAQLRAKAIFSLRFIPGEESASLLSVALADVDAGVRETAFEAMRLGAWRESYRASLQDCAQNRDALGNACAELLAAHPQVAGS